MADWPMANNSVLASAYKGGETYRLQVSTSASANTKGAWTEATASTTHRVELLIVKVFAAGLDFFDFLFDVGIGGSGSEIPIVENLYFGRMNLDIRTFSETYPIPVSIPAGTRIALRAQGASGSGDMYLEIYAFGGGNFSSTQMACVIDTYGANEADSGGVEIDPGGSAETKGSYSEITSSCEDVKGFFFCIGQKGNTGRASYYWLLDIAIGGAGSEQVVLPDWCLLSDSGSDMVAPTVSPFLPVPIPAGTRIAARASCSGTDATDRLFDLIVYGVR